MPRPSAFNGQGCQFAVIWRGGQRGASRGTACLRQLPTDRRRRPTKPNKSTFMSSLLKEVYIFIWLAGGRGCFYLVSDDLVPYNGDTLFSGTSVGTLKLASGKVIKFNGRQ